MLRAMPQDDDPSPEPAGSYSNASVSAGGASSKGSSESWLKRLLRPKSDAENLRDAIEEYIGELPQDETLSVAAHERALIANILKMRDLTVWDVMIPRADVAAIDIDASQSDLMALLSEKQYSRIPVFRETLDDVLGTIHIKDIMACLASGKEIIIRDLVRDVPVVSPSLPVLDLLLQMKESKKHMMLAVDEFGGIDGLVTIGDVVEAIVGELEDEFEPEDHAQIVEKPDGTLMADGRVDIESFEEKIGPVLTEEEREDIDTLGGLVFSIAGRVPARGEVITHESGLVFEIVDADPRRVNALRIKNIPRRAAQG